MGIKLINNSGDIAKQALAKYSNEIGLVLTGNGGGGNTTPPQDATTKDLDPQQISKHLLNILGSSQLKVELDNILETTALINDSCNVALETLNDMLTFDKIDEKKLLIELTEENPWQIVSDTVKPFRINALDANVTLKTHCVDIENQWLSRYAIRVDRFKLNQVIRNLVSNALKFTPPLGYVSIKVEMRTNATKDYNFLGGDKIPDNFVRLSIKDSGHGISKENQSRLFSQYVQFDAGAMQQGKGSGLGLWIAKSKLNIYFSLLTTTKNKPQI
jgi:signal transduction histidine kinase